MFSTSRITIAMVVLCATFFAAGCATTSERGAMSDPVTGYYAGRWWYGDDPDGRGGGLTCTVTPAGEDTWHATFIAEFGEIGTYEVPLDGKREDGRVVFGGAHDLGGDFGVYNWTGEVVDGVFRGDYEGGRARGSFRMEKSEPPEV